MGIAAITLSLILAIEVTRIEWSLRRSVMRYGSNTRPLR